MLVVFRRLIERVLHAPVAGGVVLAVAAALALVVSNSPWANGYQSFLMTPGLVDIGSGWLVLSKPLLVWVNDLWMAVFFFLVGLEIKREMAVGALSSFRQAVLPAGAALGGMLVPALVYAGFNLGSPVGLRGWAIPAATDIAFALGILVLLGPRVPQSLKVFLTAVAVIDDLGAILVIALFYTSQLSLPMLGWAAAGGLGLVVLNRMRVHAVGLYVIVGLLIWVFVLKSGVHATLAGVLTAMAVPVEAEDDQGHPDSPLRRAEHALHPWVTFGVLPMFAFTNAGVSLQGVSASALLQGVPLGIALGLLLGKPVGVLGATWLLVRWGGARLPDSASWGQMLGVSVLCGVGFTMSLFIGMLAFAGEAAEWIVQLKLGVLAGSMLSGMLGAFLLWRSAPATQ